MSSVAVTDKRGGVFQVVINFTYGECDRLPYNAMRKVKARIEQVPHGGIKSTAEFNIRNPKDAANFVEVLDLFGHDGSFVHGSGADPDLLDQENPPEDDDKSGSLAAMTVNASMAAAGAAETGLSPEKIDAGDPAGSMILPGDDADDELLYESSDEPEDLETEEDATLETEDEEPELEVEEEKD